MAAPDPEALAMVLAREQPQTVALVSAPWIAKPAAPWCWRSSRAQRAEVLKRMATIEGVAPEVLREVGQALATAWAPRAP